MWKITMTSGATYDVDDEDAQIIKARVEELDEGSNRPDAFYALNEANPEAREHTSIRLTYVESIERIKETSYSWGKLSTR